MITPLPSVKELSIKPRAFIESRDRHAGWCEIETIYEASHSFNITVMNPSGVDDDDRFYNSSRMASRIIKALNLLDALESQNFIIAKRD